MFDVDDIKGKFVKSVIKNLNKENFLCIVKFLKNEQCDFIEDIVSDYLDLFTFDYIEFIEKYNKLNDKYNGNFLSETRKDMNLLQEFYII